jgi:periplasmic protein TonB
MRYLSCVRTLSDAEDRGAAFDRPSPADRLTQELQSGCCHARTRDKAAIVVGLLSRTALRIRFRISVLAAVRTRHVRARIEVLSCIYGASGLMKPSPFEMRSERGSAAPKIIILVLILAAAAGGAWWFLTQRGATPTPATTASTSATPGSATADEVAPAAASAAVEGLSIDQLYREARKAMAEQRMVAPAGNNALEFYLAILEKDETNSGALDALRELFPFASGTAEQEINQGNLDEADRIIGSLAKADPSNYTLTILRSKLDAKKKQVELQAAQAAAAAAAPAPKPASSAPAETAGTEATAAADTAGDAPASSTATTAKPGSTAAPAPAATRPPPAPVAAAPQGETRDVEVVTPSPPSYPSQAARNREEGWVEVEFTVMPDGKVVGAKVTASDPARVFDREAVRSIEKTKFSPRLENGVPVSATVRRRIEFRLGR